MREKINLADPVESADYDKRSPLHLAARRVRPAALSPPRPPKQQQPQADSGPFPQRRLLRRG